MRRGVGVGALKKAQERNSSIALQGQALEAKDLAAMHEQMKVFKSKLEEFARRHKKEINNDPILRKRFHEMCTSIGVDPLSSQKGFWAQMLGVGDFYYDLGVQIIDVCLRTRHQNGGFLEMNSLLAHLNALRAKTSHKVSQDDIERSIAKLKILGSGFRVTTIGKAPQQELKIVQSVPLELNQDHAVVLQFAAQKPGQGTSKKSVRDALKWDDTRSLQALEFLEGAGLAWIDDQAGERLWYFPSLIQGLLEDA